MNSQLVKLLCVLDSHLMISKCDKRERPERFGDKDVSNLAILHEVLSQFISSHVLCAATNKHFTIIGTRLEDKKQKYETGCHCGMLAFVLYCTQTHLIVCLIKML